MIKIVPLEKKHIDDAAKLAARCYRRLRGQIPDLPDRYADQAAFYPHLEHIINVNSPGVAAERNGILAGYLTGWQLESFRGEKSIFSPEWANAAEGDDSTQITELLYGQLAKLWTAEDYGAHYISLFADDAASLKTWHWLGFGMISVDAIRGLDPIPGIEMNSLIRAAEEVDLQIVVDLHQDLRRYMEKPPTLLPTDEPSRDFLLNWIKDPSKSIWLGIKDSKPESFIRSGPADDDVCTIILDKETTSIYAAYTRENSRNKGTGSAILNQVLESARKAGYSRCAVAFEPMNTIGSRFWLKYFKPVCYSVLRHIDRRLISGYVN